MLGPKTAFIPLLAAGNSSAAAGAPYRFATPEGIHRYKERAIVNVIDDVYIHDGIVPLKKYAQPAVNTAAGFAKFGAVGGAFALGGPLGAGAVVLLGGALGVKSLANASYELNRYIRPERGQQAIGRGRIVAQQLWLLVQDDPAIVANPKETKPAAYVRLLKELDYEIGKLDYIVPRMARIQRSIPAMLMYVPEKAIALALRGKPFPASFLADTHHYVRQNNYRNAFHAFRATLPETYEAARAKYQR